MLRLSQGHWLNLDQIVEVCEQKHTLVVVCTPVLPNEMDVLETYTLYLMGEERDSLLAWLAHHGQVWSVSRPADNDNPFEESTDEPAD
jgi:hypothetical protein